jgi:Flp pilus assembly protein TadG
MKRDTLAALRRLPRALAFTARFSRDRAGVAAIEFGFIATFLAFAGLNAADLAIYERDRLQVENAAQMGAQAAFVQCPLVDVPATINCPDMSSHVTTAVQSTGLGASVTLADGSPSEGMYCVNSSGQLQYVSDVYSRPDDCTSVGTPTNTPSDYVLVQVNYTYAPLFGFSAANLLSTTITKTAWVRLG